MVWIALLGVAGAAVSAPPNQTKNSAILGGWTGQDAKGKPATLLFRANGTLVTKVHNPDGDVVLDETYSLSGNRLAVYVKRAYIENMPAAKRMLKAQLDQQLNRSAGQRATMTLSWQGRNGITLVDSQGRSMRFHRGS